MANAGKRSEVIRRLRRKLTEILRSDPDAVLDELDGLLLVTQEEYFKLSEISCPEKRVRAVLNTVLQKGEDTCNTFLESLKNLHMKFPGLGHLLEGSGDGDGKGPIHVEIVDVPMEVSGDGGASNLENGFESPMCAALMTEETPEGASNLENGVESPMSAAPMTEETPEGASNLENGVESPMCAAPMTEETPEGASNLENGVESPMCAAPMTEETPEGASNLENGVESPMCAAPMTEETPEGASNLENGVESPTCAAPMIEETPEGASNLENGVESPTCAAPMTEETPEGASNFENCVESPMCAAPMTEETPEERRMTFDEILSRMKLDVYQTTKLSLQDVLEIGMESLNVTNLKAPEDVLWHVLRNIMTLNVTARNTSFENHSLSEESANGPSVGQSANDIFSLNTNDTQRSINPLDVLCVLFYCSDSFLQQEIMLKMSMCQFALPLLLPPCNDLKGTVMLWAMRDIVRKWRPHSLRESKGFREKSLVLTPMPTISFVRLGTCNLSKSKLLNEVLSPPQQRHDFFVHRDMESGNVERRISNGLVEISWYFPGGRENSDLFPEPVAVTNLRGDIESHWLQFTFLSEISSAVFLLIDTISEREYKLLLSLKESKTKYYFILNSHTGDATKTVGFLNKLAPAMNLDRSRLLEKGKTTNDAEFVKKLQSTVLRIVTDPPSTVTVESMATTGRTLGYPVDEDSEECQRAARCVNEITKGIKDVAQYKKKMMTLQGDLWKRLAKAEKECCRMRQQGDTPPEVYKCQLRNEISELRRQQDKCNLTDGMIKFIAGIGQSSKVEKHYFLKWMKFNLDNIARENLCKLRAEYKELFSTLGDNHSKLSELDKEISESSLGLEHFMRELGQYYEAKYSMTKNAKKRRIGRELDHLTEIAADLLLEGFPLELIDGDASNIPLQWITDVLTKLNGKLEGRSRVIVITVLGVQSTGKSTLLNTMFGLQFSVSSGRCTRGAFMLLIKVKDNLKKELGCDFILVIDTEGLKAPELSMLEDSYEHDNELATQVIGLSDITIVNIAMENATEMKDILQIVVHAFLRMEETGQTPNCQFVHQNVSDVSAYDQNMRDRKHLLEQLNEMTKTAAKMEKQSRDMMFSDIMEYDPEKHNWYIPGLWHGVPPMAPVNKGYSENVHEFKKYLFEYIRNRSTNRDSKDIVQFMEWVKSLWNAVKHENFIFSFRNSLVAEAYNLLCMKYSEWEWAFRKEMHLWVSKAETVIHNQIQSEPDPNIYNTLKQEAFQKLEYGQQNILSCVQKYFDSGVQNLHLIEKYREDFNRSAKSLKNELECCIFSKFEEAVRIQKSKHKIETLQAKYMKEIEGKVVGLLEVCRNDNRELNEEELGTAFGSMWDKTLTDLQLNRLEQRQVSPDMHCHLMKDLSSLGSFANQLLQNAQSLHEYGEREFKIKQEYFNLSWYSGLKERFTNEHSRKSNELSQALMGQCMSYVAGKASSNVDYDGTYCRELLHLISDCLHRDDFRNLHTTPHFEVDLKLHILGRAARVFQKMHEDFVQENDPQSCLEKFKAQYLATFKDIYLKKDECQKRAKDFCYQCLRPALIDHISRMLGLEVVDDILQHGHSMKYSSRMFFQFDVLGKLFIKKSFESYKKYICNYEDFVKEHIFEHILDHCNRTGILKRLETNILSTITKRIREVIHSLTEEQCKTIPQFLEVFCKAFQNDLVISKSSLDVILFQSTANVDQFSDDAQFFLTELEQDILKQCEETDIGEKLTHLPYKPQDELFKKVFGCAKQCPFCKAPCEAGGLEHREHFASIHRPQGLGGCANVSTRDLVVSLCSTDIVSARHFRCNATGYQWHPYKDYRMYFPDWRIQPDASIEASDYWKFVFKQFNQQFAKYYSALPAVLPADWSEITKNQARKSILEAFNMWKN